MNKFEYAMPKTLSDAFQYLEKNSEVKGGGIDLLDLMKEEIISPKRLVNLSSIKELNYIKETDKGGLLIGPSVTLDELATSAKIKDGAFQALAQAAGAAATPQIRNVATLAGNLCQRPRCWYFRDNEFPCLRKGGTQCYAIDGENQNHAIFGNRYGCVIVHPSATAVALIALNATIKIASAKETKKISLEEFFVSPAKNITRENILNENEIITEISLPAPAKGLKSFYYKQKAKQTFDWPIAEVAVALQMEGNSCKRAKVLLGAAAPIPWRATQAEGALTNQTISKALAEKAAKETMKEANPLSQNAYKVRVFQAAIKRAICWAAGINPME